MLISQTVIFCWNSWVAVARRQTSSAQGLRRGQKPSDIHFESILALTRLFDKKCQLKVDDTAPTDNALSAALWSIFKFRIITSQIHEGPSSPTCHDHAGQTQRTLARCQPLDLLGDSRLADTLPKSNMRFSLPDYSPPPMPLPTAVTG